MGTRSLTVFVDERGKEIVVLYRQYDGYPEGHGRELAEFLSGFQVVNGFGQVTQKLANGMGCLTAQAIAHFKDGVGQFYLYPAGKRDIGEEYTYFVKGMPGQEPQIEVYENILQEGKYDNQDKAKPDVLNQLFSGPAHEVLAAIPA